MTNRRRLLVLFVLLAIAAGISAWVNVPPWLTRRRAAEHYRLGLEHARRGANDSALAEWRIATRIDPDYPEPYRKLGEFLLEKAERPDLASQYYAQLSAIDPDGPHVYCNFAKALALQNELAEAREYARMAVKAEPDCGLAHNMRGAILMTDQQVSEGLKELARACELAPDNTTFAVVLAQAYLDTSHFAEAEQVLGRILRKEPGNGKAHYLMGWAIARGPNAMRNRERALKHFREAARLEPDAADIYSEWGKLLLQAGRKQEAVRALERAWELNPRLAQVAHNLTTVYRLLGQEEKARQMERQEKIVLDRITRLRVLQKKTKANPRDHNLILQLAALELEDGNLTDAMRYVQGVLRLHPSDRRALSLLARLYAVGGKPDLAESVREHLRSLPGQPSNP